MVATRRTAPTGADTEMADPELALKKKPVRKATAKAVATKAKSTRGRKADETAPVEDEAEVVEEAPKLRATRGRPKKTVEVAAEPEPQVELEEPVKPTKATRATTAGSVRGKKAAVAVEEVPELPTPKEAKPARQTRAAASKAAPLSPKKITQVVKPQTRNAKAAGEKTTGKGTAAKNSVRGRAATRGRKVSDENAEVPVLAQLEVEDESVIEVSSTPVKKPVTRRQAAKKREGDESEISMSTRDTTPTASPALSQNGEAESEVDEPSADLSTPEKQDQTVDNEDSDDELCGPKTPMRRGSPGAEARYHSSAQRTIRKYNEEQRMQTPARRYAVLGSQRGTPQTQKPYCKPAPPSSEVRPMTVARGANRAFVFRDLRDGAPELPRPQRQQRDAIAEEEDLSFIPDDNIISTDEEEYAQLTTPSAPAPLQLASPPTSRTDVEDNEDDEQDDLDSVEDHADDFGVSADDDEANAAAEDPDATIITEDHNDETELDAPAQHPGTESFETEDTVIINRPEHSEDAADVTMSTVDDDSENSVIHYEPAASSTPETMVWENVQPEQTIAVNFDQHLNEARSLPEPEPTEVLVIAAALDAHLEQSSDAVAGANEVSQQEAEEANSVEENLSTEDAAVPLQTPALDMNEYFDMTALAEPTQVIDFAPQPEAIDMDMEDAPEADIPAEDEDLELTTVDNKTPVKPAAEIDIFDEPDLPEEPEATEVTDRLSENDDSAVEEDDVDTWVTEPANESQVPRYARSTVASRRKSLPSTSMLTPVRIGTRPNTSDGASMPRMANPFGQAWWARSRPNSNAATPAISPLKSRPGTAHGAASVFTTPAKSATPAAKERYPVFAARQNQVDHSQTVAPPRFRDVTEKPASRRQTFHRAISGKTQKAPSPTKPSTPAAAATPVQKTKERYPALGSQSSYVDHSQTAAPPARFKDAMDKPADRRKTFHRAISGKTQAAPTPVKPSTQAKASPAAATPMERYPALGARSTYVDHAKTVAPPARFQDPASKPANRRQTFHRAIPGKAADKEAVATTPAQAPIEEALTPQPQQTPTERFPRLRPQSNYEQHAKTVAAPRFHTPAKSPPKRPATTQKPPSMRKAALRNSASTPMKTPLKAPAMTPGQEPMTPHPAAPLRGIVALVEVYTLEGASASAPFTALLHRLGAKTTRTWNDRVTHVIFKDGSPTTLQRVRLHNKDVAASGNGNHVCCVNSRWVSDCDTAGSRCDESDEAYAVDVEEVPRGGKRRRKSMEPSALMNLGGNVVRDRKSSLGRSSLGRSSLRISESSPAKKAKMDTPDATPGAEQDKENSDEEPTTPAWIAAPEKLVQQTAPQKRVRKLELQGSRSRRLTFWDGGN